MQSKASTPKAYIAELPEDRKEPIRKFRKVILDNLPNGFEEQMTYGMLGYVVPHSRYPDGYHCDPKQPLGIYSDPKLLDWFTNQWPKHMDTKLDMGKCCIRFKNPTKIPYELMGELVQKMTVDAWIERYEKAIKK